VTVSDDDRTPRTKEVMTRALKAAIVQDAQTNRVLMLGWMNEEAERLTRETGEVWFWSRSRERLWRKGETSGNTLAVEEIRDDCDGDALVVRAAPAGPTCHTGATSCFAPALWRTIAQRAAERPEGSYTTELLNAGIGAAARKVGEEAVEVTVAALDESDDRLVEEAADLVYHLYVLLAARGIDLSQVEDELVSRANS
jgi:phosphoribosyl-ATP pyrophosphohydrolase/phosphoribosyl-AMP cyclohydrolase